MPHTGNGNRNPLNRSQTNDARKARFKTRTSKTTLPTSTSPKASSTSVEKNPPKKRAERTSVGRVINGWKVIAKVRKSEIGKIPHPIYRGICPVCGKEKDQELASFRNSMTCACAQYKRSNKSENLEYDMVDMEDVVDMEESY